MNILLIISGGIAAYKSLDLISKLRKNHHNVTPVMTQSACEFITPLAVASISGKEVLTDLFSTKEGEFMHHIHLSRTHDCIVVAPATANIIAKMAHGMADDLASNLLLAANKPILICPAMNTQMWHNHATQRNIKNLRNASVAIIGPESGKLACGETGEGRMADIEDIIDQLDLHFNQVRHLSGKKALVTSGPTIEAIDPVRYLSNHSSGKQGYAIAESLMQAGASVTLITGPTSIPIPNGIDQVIPVRTAQEMLAASLELLPVDIAVCAAAVSDWKIKNYTSYKIKKQRTNNPPQLDLEENPDILHCISTHQHRPELVIGFAAETENVIEHAQEKIKRKQCDWIVANDVSKTETGFGSNNNKVAIIDHHNVEKWPLSSKKIVAESLTKRIMKHFASQPKAISIEK